MVKRVEKGWSVAECTLSAVIEKGLKSFWKKEAVQALFRKVSGGIAVPAGIELCANTALAPTVTPSPR